MEKDVKLREFCLQLALAIKGDTLMLAADIIKIAREIEKYILQG